MQSPIRVFLNCAAYALVSAASGQNHQTFPNISGEFTTMWLCVQPPDNWSYMEETHIYLAEPATEFAGKYWGSLNGESIGLAVEGSQVFYYDTWLDSVIILYDFSLNMGDTAYWDNYMSNGPAIVAAVDTVAIQGQQRRRLILTDVWGNLTDDWLEGIGSLQGLLRPLWETPLGCGPVWYDYCAEYSDDLNNQYTWCTDIVMPAEQIDERSDLKIYPNPASSAVTVERKEANHASYRLFDLNGRAVKQGMVGKVTTIDLANVPTGLYFLDVDAKIVKIVVE